MTIRGRDNQGTVLCARLAPLWFHKRFWKGSGSYNCYDAIGIGVGIVGGAIVAAELALAIAVGFAVGMVGVGLSFAEDAWKTKWIGY